MARSEKKTDIWGNEYVQHYDDDGNETGRSEAKKNIWGDSYTEHRDKDGDVVGESREKSTWLGDKYTEHRDKDDNVSGRSEQKSTWLGDRYSEHRDKDDNVVGESREKSTWLGDKYVEYTPSESSRGSDSSYGSVGGYRGGSGGGESPAMVLGCGLIIMCCLGGVCYKIVEPRRTYVPPPVWTPPVPSPRPSPRPAPILSGCTLVSSTEFHLRLRDDPSRSGSVRVSSGVRVQVLERGLTTRRSDVAHRVRTEDGREGWMFLDPTRLDGADCATIRGGAAPAERLLWRAVAGTIDQDDGNRIVATSNAGAGSWSYARIELDRAVGYDMEVSATLQRLTDDRDRPIEIYFPGGAFGVANGNWYFYENEAHWTGWQNHSAITTDRNRVRVVQHDRHVTAWVNGQHVAEFDLIDLPARPVVALFFKGAPGFASRVQYSDISVRSNADATAARAAAAAAAAAAVVAAAAIPGEHAPPAPELTRMRWEVPGWSYFQRGSDGTWQEHQVSGSIAQFVETERTPQYIELYDQSRRMSFRIYAEEAQWRIDQGAWNRWDHTGHWASDLGL